MDGKRAQKGVLAMVLLVWAFSGSCIGMSFLHLRLAPMVQTQSVDSSHILM